MDEANRPATASPPLRRFDSRTEARAVFDATIGSAVQSVRLFDRDGEFYGLYRPTVAASLDRLLRLHRQTEAIIVLTRPEYLRSHAVRLRNLQRLHGDRLRLLTLEGRLAEMSRGLVLIDETVVLRRPHVERFITIRDTDDKVIRQTVHWFDELLEHAVLAVSADTTGL